MAISDDKPVRQLARQRYELCITHSFHRFFLALICLTKNRTAYQENEGKNEQS